MRSSGSINSPESKFPTYHEVIDNLSKGCYNESEVIKVAELLKEYDACNGNKRLIRFDIQNRELKNTGRYNDESTTGWKSSSHSC